MDKSSELLRKHKKSFKIVAYVKQKLEVMSVAKSVII